MTYVFVHHLSPCHPPWAYDGFWALLPSPTNNNNDGLQIASLLELAFFD